MWVTRGSTTRVTLQAVGRLGSRWEETGEEAEQAAVAVEDVGLSAGLSLV